MRCRKCKSVECNLSRRNSIECMVGQILPLRPYRCLACHTRFWGLNRPSLTIGRAAIAGFGLFLFLWLFAGFFAADKRPLTIQPAIQASNQMSAKANKDSAAVVKVEEKVTNSSKVLKAGQQDPQVVLGKADSPGLNATRLRPFSDLVKVLSEQNRKSKPGMTPVISSAIESEPASTKSEKQVREKMSGKAVSSVASSIPEKKPLLPGRLRLERMSLKPTSGATLVLHTNQASAKANTDNTSVVETEEKVKNPSEVLQAGQPDPQVVLGEADSPGLNATRLRPFSDLVKVLSEQNKKSKSGATPVISSAIESGVVSTKSEKQVREKMSGKAVSSVASSIPEKKPLLPGRLRLERMSLKPTSGATLVLHTNRQIENYTFLRLEGPARMVVDLPGKWSLSKQIQLLIVVEDDLVKRIRLGQNPDNLRIVFDLGSTPVNEPLFESKVNSLEITLIAE